MQPITRKEMYLNRLAGQQAQAIPAEPITREEQYLGRLCGENNVIPEEPRTRKEIYLANLCGEDVTPPAEAITRIEQYMAFASGERETKPANPLTREEWYWDKYQGGDVPEEKTIAFTDIITVTDALARPAVDLQSEITATQNLNGYDYPWVGGAGENLLDPNIKFPNEAQFGLTITSADGYNFSYTGTATSSGNIYSTNVSLADAVILPAGTYISKNGTLSLYKANGGWLKNQYSGVAFTIDEPFYVRNFYWEIIEGRTYNTNSFIALAKGSTAPSAWTPYENICPISGRTEVNVTRTGNEPYEGDTFNTELGRTVYGGTLDLTTGELKITHAYVDLGDLTWTTSLSSYTPNLFGAYINNKKDGNTNFITTSYRTVKKPEMSLANGEATGRTKTIDEPMTYIFVKDERATTAEEFTTLVTGQKMVYELATPQTISLTPTEVMMLENNNTIWADAGRVQLTYLSKAAQRVQSMNASLKANTLKITKAITGGVKA